MFKLSRFYLILERHGQTDRQTDRQTTLVYQYRASVCWRAIKMYDTGRYPQGTSPNTKPVAFWGYFFMHSHFPHLHTLPVLSPLSFFTSPFTAPIPFPKEVNKKLSYRGQNAFSIIKRHERNTVSELFLSVRQSRMTGDIMLLTCSFVRPSVRLFVLSSVTNFWTLSMNAIYRSLFAKTAATTNKKPKQNKRRWQMSSNQARVNHNLLTVTTRWTVHQWHTSRLKLNGRYRTLRIFYLYQLWRKARRSCRYHYYWL